MERNILNIVDNSILDHSVVSKRRVANTKQTGSRKARTEGQNKRILLRENKNCKMQHISAFCNYSCSVAADRLGLYCSVNRQDMERDSVSVFCYSKRCGLRVRMW